MRISGYSSHHIRLQRWRDAKQLEDVPLKVRGLRQHVASVTVVPDRSWAQGSPRWG